MKNIFNPNTKSYKILFGITCVVATVTAGFFISRAGSLNPTSAPTTTTMNTLDDIYCKLTGCTPAAHSLDSPGTPGPTMHSLSDIYNVVAGTTPPVSTWSNLCIYKTGDQTCPSHFPTKLSITQCNSYTCTGGGATLSCSTSSCWGYNYCTTGAWTCSGQGCTSVGTDGCVAYHTSGTLSNIAGTGGCASKTTYTLCCK